MEVPLPEASPQTLGDPVKPSFTIHPVQPSHISQEAHSGDSLRSFFGIGRIAIAIALIAGLLFCQAAVAADAARFEAEFSSFGSFASVVDSNGASGGKALRYEDDGTATKRIVSSLNASKVVVRARNSDYSTGSV